MNLNNDFNDLDITRMLSRPLYFGLIINIVLPGVLLFGCYYYQKNFHPENYFPEFANILFYIFAVIAVAQAGFALWWRDKLMRKPMVHRLETMEADIANSLAVRSKAIFLVISSIAIWGFLYFLLTGRFESCAMFVVFSFVVFQVVRPRYGSLNKLIRYQKELANSGKFAQSQID